VPTHTLAVKLPGLAFGTAVTFLVLARLFWSPTVFGLLATPIFLVAALLSLTLIFYYLALLYLLVRGFFFPTS
jgi:hypothetical protein